jgi:hypothetical protein
MHQPGLCFQEGIMARTKLSATCAAVLLSLTFVSAQTNRGRAPDEPLPNNKAAKSPQTTTISGCVVRDAANNGDATISVKGTSYKLTGKRAAEFDSYLGKRVEVTGTLDSGATGVRATNGTEVPKDQTATAGQADVPATDAPRDNTNLPLKTDKGTTADLTARLQVKTIRVLSPNCL